MKKRCKRWLGILLALVGILCLAYLLMFRVFVLRRVELTGNGNLSAEAIMNAAGLQRGIPIWQIDMEQLQRSIEALGTVKLQEGKISFPSTLKLQTELREPVAMISYGGGMLTMDRNLCVIQQLENVPDADLIYISGMEAETFMPGQPYQMPGIKTSACRTVLQALLDNHAHIYVSEIDLTNVQNLALITRSGMRVHLQDAQDMQYKTVLLKAVVADLEHGGESGGELYLFDRGRADYRPAIHFQESK